MGHPIAKYTNMLRRTVKRFLKAHPKPFLYVCLPACVPPSIYPFENKNYSNNSITTKCAIIIVITATAPVYCELLLLESFYNKSIQSSLFPLLACLLALASSIASIHKLVVGEKELFISNS